MKFIFKKGKWRRIENNASYDLIKYAWQFDPPNSYSAFKINM